MTKKARRPPRHAKAPRPAKSGPTPRRSSTRNKDAVEDASSKDPRPRHRAATERDLIAAVSRVLAEQGAALLTPSNVAHAAAVDKALIYRYFGSFHGLVEAFTNTALYWPTVEEIAPDRAALLALPFAERMACLLLRYGRAMRARPDTLAILAGQLAERGEFQGMLEARREAFGQALYIFAQDAPADFDVAAAATLLTGAIHYLLIRGRQVAIFNGIPLGTDAGWQRLEAMIGQLLGVNPAVLASLASVTNGA
jgi:AcrR family transcriptional regulator